MSMGGRFSAQPSRCGSLDVSLRPVSTFECHANANSNLIPRVKRDLGQASLLDELV